jgi:cell division protein FtsB
MVLYQRWFSLLGNLVVWLLISAAIAYFVHHGMTGAHGLTARRGFEAEVASLRQVLSGLKADRKALDHRLELLSSATLDPDLLEEEARSRLGWLGPRDRVLVLPTP